MAPVKGVEPSFPTKEVILLRYLPMGVLNQLDDTGLKTRREIRTPISLLEQGSYQLNDSGNTALAKQGVPE